MRSGIVVAVDPTQEHDAALEFAVGQARRAGGRIHLVVVMHPARAGRVTELKLVGDELVDVAHDLLVRCERQITEWTDDIEVTTEVRHGQTASCLVAAAHGADALVLGHHRMARRQVPIPSTTHTVAARTTCPVYAVPDAWHELREHPEPVIASVGDGNATGRAIAAAAFAEARLAGSAVRVVRAWCYPDLDADEESVLHGTGVQVAESLCRNTSEALSDLIGRYPDVPCRIEAVHGPAAHVLIEASMRARLLVVGRHRPTLPWGSHLGPVTRSVLGHAGCPVVVVDARPGPMHDAAAAQSPPARST